MKINISWKENRKSLITIITGLSFLFVIRVLGGGLIVGAIVGVVFYSVLNKFGNKEIEKTK